MSYLVFARKYRPQTFEEIVGQEPIVTTLQNAIKEKRIAQSFLFSGTRGVGKTSSARILAKALNCDKGIVTDPCGKCVSCKEITDGTSLDVLEIDGASNRGIDEIRNLRENVKFKPTRGRFKIFIIDEVHMLTQEAFNALLKTLEEPPEHVKFIFATTELHKVPLTILSRCQKYSFRKVATARIAEKLQELCKQEKISHDEKSLFTIAKAADGSLRDAESLLDQVASFAKGKITYAKVIEAFGVPSDEVFLRVVNALLKKDAGVVLSIFEPMEQEGKDLVQFVRGLSEYFRALLILKVTQGSMPELVDLASETLADLQLKKDSFSKEDLLSIVHTLENLLIQVRRSPYPRLHIETALIKLAIREDLLSLAELAAKLENVSQKGPSPAAPEPRREAPVRSAAPEPRPAARPAEGIKRAVAQETVKEPAQAAPAAEIQAAVTFALNEVEGAWASIVESVKSRKMSCGTFLSEGAPVEVEGGTVVIALAPEFKFHKESLEKGENRKIVEEAFQNALGSPVRVSFVIAVPDSTSVSAAAPVPSQKESLPDIVETAMKLFDGRIIRRDTA